MTSRYEVTLNGTKLSSVNKNLLILDVAYAAPSMSNEIYKLGQRDGGVLYNRYRDKATVTVTFELHIYDIAARQTACQSVITWARNGGTLTTNDRTGQQLNVICEEFPTIESAKNWTDPLTVTFSAVAFPYWVETKETVASLTGKNVKGTIRPPGNAPLAFFNVSVKTTATLTSLRIQTSSTYINLTGLNIAANKTITFSYDDNMVLSIKVGDTSLLNKRTAASSDDLCFKAGATGTISVIASSNVTATFRTRGAWM